jgi:hypothetical protein
MIKLAFNILYGKGFICRSAFQGNQSDAVVAISKRAAERKAKGEPVKGGVFFIAADAQMGNRGPGGSYPVYFGRPQTEKLGAIGLPEPIIGAEVVNAIKQAGGWCEWDGDPTHPVIVKEN